MRRTLYILISLLALGLIGLQLEAGRRVTTRRALKAAETAPADTTVLVTVVAEEGELTASGYDKPRRTTRESMLITNNGLRAVRGVVLSITYNDLQGRMLHHARVRLNCLIAPGETKMVTWRSWDRQESYYYHRSRKGSRYSTATPYDILCSIDSISIATAAQ